MATTVLTSDDLNPIEQKLDLILTMLTIGHSSIDKIWLRSSEVRLRLGNISPGKLQDMRNKGQISYKRIGGTFLYNISEIEASLK